MTDYDTLTAGFLVGLAVAGLIPVFAAQARVTQQVVATSNLLATGFSVIAIVLQAMTYGYTMNQLSGAGAFHKLQIKTTRTSPTERTTSTTPSPTSTPRCPRHRGDDAPVTLGRTLSAVDGLASRARQFAH
jgi:hypothetical protein